MKIMLGVGQYMPVVAVHDAENDRSAVECDPLVNLLFQLLGELSKDALPPDLYRLC